MPERSDNSVEVLMRLWTHLPDSERGLARRIFDMAATEPVPGRVVWRTLLRRTAAGALPGLALSALAAGSGTAPSNVPALWIAPALAGAAISFVISRDCLRGVITWLDLLRVARWPFGSRLLARAARTGDEPEMLRKHSQLIGWPAPTVRQVRATLNDESAPVSVRAALRDLLPPIPPEMAAHIERLASPDPGTRARARARLQEYGSEVMGPVLEAHEHPDRLVRAEAARVAAAIEEDSAVRLASRSGLLLCPRCLHRTTRMDQWHGAPWRRSGTPYTFIACRSCGQNRTLYDRVSTVVLALDRSSAEEVCRTEDGIRVNWRILKQERRDVLPDFDILEIVDATDKDVLEFLDDLERLATPYQRARMGSVGVEVPESTVLGPDARAALLRRFDDEQLRDRRSGPRPAAMREIESPLYSASLTEPGIEGAWRQILVWERRIAEDEEYRTRLALAIGPAGEIASLLTQPRDSREPRIVEAAVRAACGVEPAATAAFGAALARLDRLRHDGEPPERVVDDLASDDWDERWAARHHLATLGGEAVTALVPLLGLEDEALASTARALLHTIGRHTHAIATPAGDPLVCARCLAPSQQFTEALAYRFPERPSWNMQFDPERLSITFVGCSECRGVRHLWPGQSIVAVLDSADARDAVVHDATLRVNWLARAGKDGFEGRLVFDCARVEIVRATDQEVRHFIVDLANDTDAHRRKRMRLLTCTVSRECRLEENTLRQLRKLFRQVRVR